MILGSLAWLEVEEQISSFACIIYIVFKLLTVSLLLQGNECHRSPPKKSSYLLQEENKEMMLRSASGKRLLLQPSMMQVKHSLPRQ